MVDLRLWVDLVQEPASVVLVEDSSKSPGVVLEGLHVLDFDKKNVSRLGGFNLERAREVVDLSQVDILDIVGTVVVFDLSACPVQTFNLDRLSVLDRTTKGNWKGMLSAETLHRRSACAIPSGCHLFWMFLSAKITQPFLLLFFCSHANTVGPWLACRDRLSGRF